MVMQILETEIAEDGGYIPCIAVEGERGYYRTDWNWGKDKEQAQKFCDERNELAGISKEEAYKIIMGTMGFKFTGKKGA